MFAAIFRIIKARISVLLCVSLKAKSSGNNKIKQKASNQCLEKDGLKRKAEKRENCETLDVKRW